MSWLESAFADPSPPVTLILVVIGLALLLVLSFWLFRKIAGGNRMRTPRNARPRLSVTDAAIVDDKRRLVLVRRDGVEHLLMIGGPSDIVIEQNITRQNEAPYVQGEPAPAQGYYYEEPAPEPAAVSAGAAPQTQSFENVQPDDAFFDAEAFEAEVRNAPSFDEEPGAWEDDIRIEDEHPEPTIAPEPAAPEPPQPARRREAAPAASPAPAPVPPAPTPASASPRNAAPARTAARTEAAPQRQPVRQSPPAYNAPPPAYNPPPPQQQREAPARRKDYEIGTAGIAAAGAAATHASGQARPPEVHEDRQASADEEEFLSALSAHEAFPGDPASGYPEDFGELLETNLSSHLADDFNEEPTLDDEVTLDDIVAPQPEPKPAPRAPANKRDEIEDEMQKLLDDLTKA